MKKIGKVLMLCLLATFIAGSAMAVELAQNNTGDMLIFPAYAADGTGWETKFTVINTSTTDAVVAKVVVRGAKFSLELVDFFIYLSPADVWTGKIFNDNGVVKIYSEDDSVQSSASVWANTVPMERALETPACEDVKFGYVTVYEAWNTANLGGPGTMTKDDIKTAYASASAFAENTSNALYGKYEILLPALGLSAAENAVAFMDYDIRAKIDLLGETYLGEDASATIDEIEALLAKEHVFMPYYNDGFNLSAHLFTFPTKLILPNAQCLADNTNRAGQFWLDNKDTAIMEDYEVIFGLKYFDLEENSPSGPDPIFSPIPEGEKLKLPHEFNALASNYTFAEGWDEGWAYYSFQDTATLPETLGDTFEGTNLYYTGVPVIPLVLNLGADGLSLHGAAYEFGTVEEYIID